MISPQTTQATTKVVRPRRRIPERIAVHEAEAALAAAMEIHGTYFGMPLPDGRLCVYDLSKPAKGTAFISLHSKIIQSPNAYGWLIKSVPCIARHIKASEVVKKVFTFGSGYDQISQCMINFAAAVDNLPRRAGCAPSWKRPRFAAKKLFDAGAIC